MAVSFYYHYGVDFNMMQAADYSINDRRMKLRRANDGCIITHEQLDRMMDKIERSHDASIRGEHIEVRLKAVEDKMDKLCSRITIGLWGMVGSLVVASGGLIVAIWQIVQWIQELINNSMMIG